MKQDPLNILEVVVEEIQKAEKSKSEWKRFTALPLAVIFTAELTHVCSAALYEEQRFSPLHLCVMPSPHTEVDDFSSARTRPAITTVTAGTPSALTYIDPRRFDF